MNDLIQLEPVNLLFDAMTNSRLPPVGCAAAPRSPDSAFRPTLR